VFPRINVVYLVIAFLSVILSMLWLSSKLKRNLIIAQNLTIIVPKTVPLTYFSGHLLDINTFILSYLVNQMPIPAPYVVFEGHGKDSNFSRAHNPMITLTCNVSPLCFWLVTMVNLFLLLFGVLV
jgi:hypothetical protein